MRRPATALNAAEDAFEQRFGCLRAVRRPEPLTLEHYRASQAAAEGGAVSAGALLLAASTRFGAVASAAAGLLAGPAIDLSPAQVGAGMLPAEGRGARGGRGLRVRSAVVPCLTRVAGAERPGRTPPQSPHERACGGTMTPVPPSYQERHLAGLRRVATQNGLAARLLAKGAGAGAGPALMPTWDFSVAREHSTCMFFPILGLKRGE